MKYNCGSYLIFVGRVEGNFSDGFVLLALSHNITRHDLGELQQGNLRGIADAFPLIDGLFTLIVFKLGSIAQRGDLQ